MRLVFNDGGQCMTMAWLNKKYLGFGLAGCLLAMSVGGVSKVVVGLFSARDLSGWEKNHSRGKPDTA